MEFTESDDPLSAVPEDGNAGQAPVRDLIDDERDFLERLRSTGLFSPSQMQVVEQVLRTSARASRPLSDASKLQPGDQVGHYIIDELLAHGGEGYVFRGHELNSHAPIAIKILDNARTSQRFRREMKLVQRLAHPNIVTAYEVAEFDGMLFIVMELLPGPDLHAWVRTNGPLDWLKSSRYILQVARALSHAHQRHLIHRDIKPANIILSGEGQVKLVDLGLAAMPHAISEVAFFEETRDADVAGTLPYMSPEQARSLSDATQLSDIYSLGATWYYLLTGTSRLPGKSFSEQFSNLLLHRKFNELSADCLPTTLRNVYQQMVAYDAQDRFRNSEALCVRLEQALDTAGELVSQETLHILIIEDSRTDMFRTVEVLRHINQSLSIHQALTLAQGIAMCERMPIDMVLLDLNLPDSYGLETVERFRRAAENVPTIVLTGTADEETCAACMQAGISSFLSKVELTAHKMERIIFVTLSRCGQTRIDGGGTGKVPTTEVVRPK